MAHHIVKKQEDLVYEVPPELAEHSKGYTADSVVAEATGSVQMGFRISRLEDQGVIMAHVHSFEESLYVIDGSLIVDLPEGSFSLSSGDYGLIPTGVPHSVRNNSGAMTSFAQMRAPMPRERFGFDTYPVPPIMPKPEVPVDVRDPRNRNFGHIEGEDMDPTKQTQDRLAVSASMRTALLVYSGITVKMMIDSDLGADLSTMFMVQYEPGGFAGAHDHPLEEAYLILEGEVEAVFDGNRYNLGPGDVAWAGVGCVHEFRNHGPGIVRWLETQAPQPPPRHSYRFARDWTYLTDQLSETMDKGANNG